MDIIDFNQLKNRARDKDVDKFEAYIYDLYYSLSQGQITIKDLYEKTNKYMAENNISQEKFFNIQKEMMKRYGFDMDNITEQMKGLGVDTSSLNMNLDYENMRKNISFKEKYNGKIKIENFSLYSIKNSLNNVEIMLNENNVIIKSEGKVNLSDSELNEFICSYKKVVDDKELNVSMFENVKSYEY